MPEISTTCSQIACGFQTPHGPSVSSGTSGSTIRLTAANCTTANRSWLVTLVEKVRSSLRIDSRPVTTIAPASAAPTRFRDEKMPRPKVTKTVKPRSEERRVGKECGAGGGRDSEENKKER